jgi:hypothetical protein
MAKQQKLIKEIPNLWRPEFIPYYPEKVDRWKLNDKEGLMYGFIRHFLKNCSGRFFFTNEQLRYVLGTKISRNATITEIIRGLTKKCPEITLTYKRKEGGGKIRLISYVNQNPQLRQTVTYNYAKPQTIENTVNNTLRDITKEFQEISDKWEKNPNKIVLLDQREAFLAHWLEKSPNGKKCRWEMEKVFNVPKRWNTWIKNFEKWSKPKEFKKPIDNASRTGFGSLSDSLKSRKLSD